MKTIVITGASRGIGLATAKKFINEGWRVVGTYVKNQIPIDSPNLVSVQMDQGDPESIKKAVETIKMLDMGIMIDGVVNNAGINIDGADKTAHIDTIRKTFDVDLFGVIDFTERLLSKMNPGSHVVNMDSLYGAFSFDIDDESSSGYRMAKAALNMYTRTLAFRTKDKSIIVSSLDPGWVKTDMGNSMATTTEFPDREPEEAAQDVYDIVTTVKESGFFWKLGEKREW